MPHRVNSCFSTVSSTVVVPMKAKHRAKAPMKQPVLYKGPVISRAPINNTFQVNAEPQEPPAKKAKTSQVVYVEQKKKKLEVVSFTNIAVMFGVLLTWYRNTILLRCHRIISWSNMATKMSSSSCLSAPARKAILFGPPMPTHISSTNRNSLVTRAS